MQRKPPWLIVPAPKRTDLDGMKRLLDAGELHTVCESADCPNIGECFAQRTCTFMIMGNVCTRSCRFCAVNSSGGPLPLNAAEPASVAKTVRLLGLKHVVITSVTRDDLADGGAAHFAAAVEAVRAQCPSVAIEVLIPDFCGNQECLQKILHVRPQIIGHNIETVPRLYRQVRPQARYERSVALLNAISRSGSSVAKSGLMLGLGERYEEVVEVLADLKAAGCEIVTMGQYLSPSRQHLPVAEYIEPALFAKLEQAAYAIGIRQVAAGPMVRSSYHAARCFENLRSAVR